ncbi:MAG TPA: universal stress protein [Roseimicrobium sp.]|nr:universal stress protein [Roseimicrobium sp.]
MDNKNSAVQIRTVLVPVDFSKCSDAAVAYGAMMARQFHARLILLNVAELLPGKLPAGSTDFPALEQQLVSAAESKLRGMLSASGPADVEAVIKVRAGWPFTHRKPWQEILAVALEEKADLIVIGTHGRTGLDHVILGSTAERVVREAKCPVLTVRGAV